MSENRKALGSQFLNNNFNISNYALQRAYPFVQEVISNFEKGFKSWQKISS
jgi:hypothetical protein